MAPLAFWVALLALIPSNRAFDDLPPVSPSEYSSQGKVQQYVGHINDVKGLKASLEACSYRNEVIFISTTGEFVDAAAQTMNMFWWGIHGKMAGNSCPDAWCQACMPCGMRPFMDIHPGISECAPVRYTCFACNRRFGIAHIIIVTTSEEACNSTVSLIKDACCVWANVDVPKNAVAQHGFGGHRMLMQIRSDTGGLMGSIGSGSGLKK